jgi:hypothetical protein
MSTMLPAGEPSVWGKIINREKAQHNKDFSGLQFERGITPTDIDMFVEFNDEIFIFGELKSKGKEGPGGQQKAFERLVDALGQVKKTILLIAEHECETDIDIPTATCLVKKYRLRGKWRIPQSAITVREAIEKFKTPRRVS